jgi:GT2 family glycosyltransferase
MKKYQNNLVSVVIVNHNGGRYLYNCISSICHSGANKESDRISALKNIEILIFDNASSDKSMELIEKNFPKLIHNHTIKTIKSSINYGPAYARNIAAKYATGEYLNFLDNDTEVDKNWIKEALKIFKKNKKVAIVQCKLLLKKNKKTIDYVGEYLGTNGFLVQKAQGGEKDNGQFEKEEEIMAAKSAGMFIRANVFHKIDGFDNDYFIYLEETDLGIRAGIAGYKSIYCPKSIVYHVSGGSITSLGKTTVSFNSKFHGTKNYIATLIKNLETSSLITILPIHILLWIGLAGFKLSTFKFKESVWILMGIGWNIIYLPKTIYKRINVQKLRKVSDKKLFKVWMKKVPFSYFLNKAMVKKSVGKAQSF